MLASWAHEEETGQRVHLYKTNIAAGLKGEQRYTTVGSHENYLVERSSCLKGRGLLVPYLILRQVFCRAGGIVDGVYMMSPRVIFPKKVYSEVSTDYPIARAQASPMSPVKASAPACCYIPGTSIYMQQIFSSTRA